MTIWRALIVWLLMIPIAFANGTLRQMGYGPLQGEPRAHQLSCFTAIAAFGVLIFSLTRRWRFSSLGQAWGIGFLWAVLTVAFETGLGRMRGMAWREVFRDYAIWRGNLWGLVVGFVFVAPVLASALYPNRAHRARHSGRV